MDYKDFYVNKIFQYDKWLQWTRDIRALREMENKAGGFIMIKEGHKKKFGVNEKPKTPKPKIKPPAWVIKNTK